MPQKTEEEILLLNELGLLLSEKRTYFSILRTGVAVFGLSLTALGVLLATADYQKIFSQNTITAVIIVLVSVAIIGLLLTLQAGHKIQRINSMITKIEKEDKRIAKIVV